MGNILNKKDSGLIVFYSSKINGGEDSKGYSPTTGRDTYVRRDAGHRRRKRSLSWPPLDGRRVSHDKAVQTEAADRDIETRVEQITDSGCFEMSLGEESVSIPLSTARVKIHVVDSNVQIGDGNIMVSSK
ncbi:hypothetical protein ScPMuIL_007638 [Solemya velum]